MTNAIVPYGRDIKVTVKLGSVSLLPGRVMFDEAGRYLGQGRILQEFDEDGRLVRQEDLPASVIISYTQEDDDKKWWEFWK